MLNVEVMMTSVYLFRWLFTVCKLVFNLNEGCSSLPRFFEVNFHVKHLPSLCKRLVNSALTSSSVWTMNSWWLSLFSTLTWRVFLTLSPILIYTFGILLRYIFLKKTPYYCVTFFVSMIFVCRYLWNFYSLQLNQLLILALELMLPKRGLLFYP